MLLVTLAQRTDKHWCTIFKSNIWAFFDDNEGKLVQSSSPLTPDEFTPLYRTTIKGVIGTLKMIQNPAKLSEMEYFAIGGPNKSLIVVDIARGQVRDFKGLELESKEYDDYIISGKCEHAMHDPFSFQSLSYKVCICMQGWLGSTHSLCFGSQLQ